MNKFISFLCPIVKMFVVVAQNIAMQKSYKHLIKKLLSYGGAVFFLITAYVFACLSLYSFLSPYWGEALAAFFICFLFLIISFGLMMMGRGSKTPKQEPPPLVSHLENCLDSMPDSEEVMGALKKASPQILGTIVGGLAMIAIVKMFKKKE